MAFHSAQGPKLGLPQMIQSRPQFGYYGALLPVIVAVLLFIGFMAVLSYAFAIFGYRLIHVFCQWASVLFIAVYVLFGIGLAVAVHLPAGFYSFGTFKGTPFLLEMGAILSYQLTWAPSGLPSSRCTRSTRRALSAWAPASPWSG
jgi:nucleobase:cation symporter-1, NCS1 family